EKFKKRLERQGSSSRWRLREPMNALADRELTEAFLTDLNSWSITTFVNDHVESPEELSAFGFSKEPPVVTLWGKEGRSVTLEIGKEIEEGGTKLVYVRWARAPFLFTAKSDPLKSIFEGAEGFRSRFVFDLGLEEVNELHGEAKQSGWTLHRM